METEEKKKLTDTQLRIIQAIAGVISAAALIISIHVSTLPSAKDNILLQFLFVIVFMVILFSRRRIEAKYRLRLNFFNLILIDGILTGILVYVIIIFNDASSKMALSSMEKTLICIGIALITGVLGGIVPYLRYIKRKNEDKLIPIRIPEKTEEEIDKEKEASMQSSARNSVSSKIAEMTKDLDDNKTDSLSSNNSLERRIAEMTKDLGARELDENPADEALDESVDSAVDDDNEEDN
jgi:hypothetical protein